MALRGSRMALLKWPKRFARPGMGGYNRHPLDNRGVLVGPICCWAIYAASFHAWIS